MTDQSQELAIIVRVQDLASRALKSVNRELGGLEKNTWAAGRAATRGLGTAIGNIERLAAVGAGLAVGGGLKALQWAGDFQAQLNTINTVARLTPEALGAVGTTLRGIAKDTGLSLDDLTSGYYDLESAGVHGALAQAALNDAVKLGIGGLATTAETVDLLTTAINAYHLDAAGAAVATDQFALAVADGKVKASEIAATFADVASLAKTYSVGIDQVAASYAFLTAQGVPASEVTTEMQRAIISLIKPTKDLEVAQKKLKINFTEEIRKKGLVPALQELREYSDKTGIPLISLLGRVEAVKYALQTTGPNFAGFNAELEKMGHATGTAAEQAAIRQKGFNFELARLKALAHDAGITIGNALLPKVTALLARFNEFAGAHQADIARFADDLAAGFERAVQWAEKLDVGQIADSLRAAAGFAKGVVQAFLEAPAWLQQAVLTGWGLNKLTGGAVVEVGGDLLKGIIGQFAARGSSPANPMWVAQVGGAGGIGGAAGALGGIGIGTLAAAALAIAGTALLISGAENDSKNPVVKEKLTRFIPHVGFDTSKPGPAGTTGDPVVVTMGGFTGNFASPVTAGGFDSRLATDTNIAFGGFDKRLAALDADTRAAGQHMVDATDALHVEFRSNLAKLIHATKPVDVAAAAKKVGAEVAHGVGNLRTTNHVLEVLKAQLANTHDPKTAAILRREIARVEAKIPGREYVQRQITEARRVAASSESIKQKTADLKVIQRSLLAHGDTHAANEVRKLIAINTSIRALPSGIAGTLAKGGYVSAAGASAANVSDHRSHPGGQMHADGGMAYPGRIYRVNERRDEFFEPVVPTRIHSNAPGLGLMSAGAARAVMVQLQLTVNLVSRSTVGVRNIAEKTASEARYGKLSANLG